MGYQTPLDHHNKTDDELRDCAWNLMAHIKIALFTTWDGEKQAQWPLTAQPDQEANEICFLVSHRGGHYLHVSAFPAVTLGFADVSGDNYVVVNGHARMGENRARIRELWTPYARAFWDDPDDPDIRVLTVTPDRAEIWNGPNKLVAAAVMLAAAATGSRPHLGAHDTVSL